MSQRNIVSREEMNRDFRSPFLFFAAVLCVVSVAFAVPGVAGLFDKEAAELYQILLGLDYIDTSAQQSWLFVKRLIKVLALIVPGIIGVGVWLLIGASFARLSKKLPTWGLDYFSVCAKGFRMIVRIVGVILAIMFFFRAARYLIINGSQTGGVLFIFAMLLPECVFLAVVVIIFVLTLRCMRSAINTIDNLRLNVLTGRTESYGLTSDVIWLIAMVGVAAVVLGIMDEEVSGKICFWSAAVADFSIAVWLMWYRRKNGKRALATFRSTRSGPEDLFV